MDFANVEEPKVKKSITVAAMQDMANIGSIAIEFMNKRLKTQLFRYVSASYPNYVIDKGGYIEFHQGKWEYRYARNIIVFGGGIGQPLTNQELYELCQDVINVAKRCSCQLIYTLGAFHTDREVGKNPKTLVTTSSPESKEQVRSFGVEITPPSSLSTGFNGFILGFAKLKISRA
jgi:proteasome assembly chaperone (PAC2) family protein